MVSNIIKNKFSIFWILIIFIVTFNYLSFNFFIKSFISLENKENGKTLSALITHLNTNLNTIKITTKDYSYWDDTYEFINDKNENYIYENFRDSTKTLDNLKLDFMIFMNLKNENIHTQISNNLNLKNKDDFRKYIVNQFKDKESTTIIKYEEEYYYLVRSEILKSDLSAESRGYIYTGRIVRLEEFTNDYKNSIKFIETNPMKIDITLKSKFINNIDVHFDYKNDLLSNIIFLKNNAQNSVTLKLDNYRDIYKEGKKQIILFNSIVSFFMLVLFFIYI